MQLIPASQVHLPARKVHNHHVGQHAKDWLVKDPCSCDVHVCNVTQGDNGWQASARAEKSQFAGFGVAPDRDSLKPVPAQLQIDQPSMPLPHLPSEAAAESPSPVGHKLVCH